MKKILLGFIAIGLLTFFGCEKDDDKDTETTDSTETTSDYGTTETSSDYGSTDCDDETTETSSDEIADSDGNTYKTLIIGEQEWFAENLKTSKYNDGTTIPNVTNDTQWSNETTGAWCHYDNDIDYECTYGKLYNWYAVETGKLCPTGWHVPTNAEWTELIDYLSANGHNETEGKALKATSGWDDYNGQSGNGTDDYGWNGLPGEERYEDGDFTRWGTGYWWSSSEGSDVPGQGWTDDVIGLAFSHLLHDYEDMVDIYASSKTHGFSVRCLRD